MTTRQDVQVQPSGPRLFDPEPTTRGVALDQGRQSTDALVASTTQTQAAATQLQYGVNDIATCANANDAVALPQAVAGAVVHFFNSGAQTTKVFGKSGTTDTINGTAGATGVTGPGAGKMGIAICSTAGAWKLALSA